MYIERVPNRNSPPAILLRESFREGNTVRKRTLANLSKWPPELVEGFQTLLRGGTAVEQLHDAFNIVRSRPHGVVYDLFRELSRPTLKHRSLFCCLSSREQIPKRLTALLALKHSDVPLLAPHLFMKALQEVRRPDEPPERLGKRDR
jgi:hypothetical protein